MPTSAQIEVHDVTARLSRGFGIADISFTVAPGESLAILGALGSGKTTLLHVLAGKLTPDTGFLRIMGKASSRMARRIGFAPERPPYSLLSSPNRLLLRVAAQKGVSIAQRQARVAEVIDLLGLYSQRDRPLRELGTGERAATAVAAALVHRPAIVILDNPMASLPDRTVERLWGYLDTRRARDSASVVYATSRAEEAERASLVLLLDSGKTLGYGAPTVLLSELTPDTIVVEAASPEAVQRTLRGIFDVELTETRDGVRFAAFDGAAATSHLLRHPVDGARAIYLKPPTLWDAMDALKRGRSVR